MKKNQVFTVRIDSCTPEGFGVCHIEGRAVFVQGALEKEDWEILILKVTNTAVFAKALRCVSPSGDRIPQDCPNPCGGCTLRHAAYEKELEIKRRYVDDCLRRIGGLDLTCSEIHPAPDTLRYRNKAVFAVSTIDGKAEFGFYRPRSHTLVPVRDCLLQSSSCITAAEAVIDFMNRNSIQPYDETTGKGVVRHLFWRESRSGDAVLCIVAARGFGSLTASLTEELRMRCPFLTGIVLAVNKGRLNTVLDGVFYTLWGDPDITEEFCGVSFRIAPRAFLQVNVLQAEAIYEKVREYAGSGELALDLYCGTGTIALCLASSFTKVIGAEIVEEAVTNARENAERNHMENASFLCADIGELSLSLHNIPDVIVLDPPRKGLDERVIRDVAGIGPDRIIYVSCNPATLARDLQRFADCGYKAELAEAFDRFPRTAHVETVCLLTHS